MAIGVKAARAWDEWEGQIIDGKFPLLRYLGGSERSAVFLTERSEGEPRRTAIKLFPADDHTAEAQLARWRRAAAFSHPNLVRLFEMGRARLGDISFAYVLMEYAEEDLSQVGRPLTVAEATDMLGGVLSSLAYLHGKKIAHGHVKPSNIMAVADQLKTASDTIRPTGEWRGDLDATEQFDPPEIVDRGATLAGDIWSLGVTLVEAVTKQLPLWERGAAALSLPDSLPTEFRVPAQRCLVPDPQQRWTVADFTRFLQQSAEPSALSQRESSHAPGIAKRRYLLPAGAVGLTLVAAAIVPRLVSYPETPAPPMAQPAALRPESVAKPEDGLPKTPVREAPSKAAPQDIIKQVLPEVPVQARNTIRGKVTVTIRVAVDSTGSVVDAENESPASSRFFGNLALQAARQWKFAPMDPRRSALTNVWALHFRFVQDPKRPVAVQVAPWISNGTAQTQ